VRRVGLRADEGHLRVRREGQGAVVRQQHDRSLGHLAGQCPGRGRVELDRALGAQHRGSGVPVGVEQAQLALLAQDALERPVDQREVDLTGLEGLDERLAEAGDGGQLDVDPRVQGLPGGVGLVARDAVQGREEGHREVVGDDGAAEAVGRRAGGR
jgi:hypothetical protein